jgi:hypothetical protein
MYYNLQPQLALNTLKFGSIDHIALNKFYLGRLGRETITTVSESWNVECLRAVVKIFS